MAGNIQSTIPERDEIPLDDGLSSHQEGVPVMWWWGERRVAGQIISGIIDPVAVEATDRPQKK